jgi:hypothetical protein
MKVAIAKNVVLVPDRKAQQIIGEVRPLAEYNGAGLRTTKVSFYLLSKLELAYLRLPASEQKRKPAPTKKAIKKSEKLIICDWCMHAGRNPILSCVKCNVLLCAHAKRGGYPTTCAKHAK